MNDIQAILPNFQIGPIWLIAAGVALGWFLKSKFPNILPNVFAPQPKALTADDVRAIVVDALKNKG